MSRYLVLLGIISSSIVMAQAQDNSDLNVGSKILAVENVWNQAEAKGDIRALDLIFDDLLIYVDEDGTLLSKTEFLMRAKQAGAQPQSLNTESMHVRVYGDLAIVTGIYRAKGVNRGKAYQESGRFTDVWISHNSTWICVAAQATAISH